MNARCSAVMVASSSAPDKLAESSSRATRCPAHIGCNAADGCRCLTDERSDLSAFHWVHLNHRTLGWGQNLEVP
jgi:hypothetical protein